MGLTRELHCEFAVETDERRFRNTGGFLFGEEAFWQLGVGVVEGNVHSM